MLGAEVRTQVHNLPRPKTDEEPGGADAEPLDTGVGALVGIAQRLLAVTQILHLVDNLGCHFLDTAQVGLDGLKLLGSLDGGPVLGVGADVDVELNVAGGGAGATGCVEVRCAFRSRNELGEEITGERKVVEKNIQPDNRFSKQTSKAASECDVKTTRDSPTTSLGRPYSLPTASRIFKDNLKLAFTLHCIPFIHPSIYSIPF